jgi:hypothetical protein
MRFEEQPLRMNLFSPAFFPSVLRFYAGNLQTAEKPRERGQKGVKPEVGTGVMRIGRGMGSR